MSGNKHDHLQSLCETRWVERITALENFACNYIPIVCALMAFSLWDYRETRTKSKTLVKAISNSTFIMALLILYCHH